MNSGVAAMIFAATPQAPERAHREDTPDEGEGVFKARKVHAHKYSKAWIPVEDDPRRRKGIKVK